MKHIYHAEVLASLASGAKATLDFEVPTREQAVELIKTIAKDLERTWEETTQVDGQAWFSIVTHNKDNYEINVWVQPDQLEERMDQLLGSLTNEERRVLAKKLSGNGTA
jgi:uncharacterized protein YpmB